MFSLCDSSYSADRKDRHDQIKYGWGSDGKPWVHDPLLDKFLNSGDEQQARPDPNAQRRQRIVNNLNNNVNALNNARDSANQNIQSLGISWQAQMQQEADRGREQQEQEARDRQAQAQAQQQIRDTGVAPPVVYGPNGQVNGSFYSGGVLPITTFPGANATPTPAPHQPYVVQVAPTPAPPPDPDLSDYTPPNFSIGSPEHPPISAFGDTPIWEPVDDDPEPEPEPTPTPEPSIRPLCEWPYVKSVCAVLAKAYVATTNFTDAVMHPIDHTRKQLEKEARDATSDGH